VKFKKEIKMTAKYLIGSMYCGDTLLDVYGELSDPEPNLGYNGDIDIYDVKIANTEVSVINVGGFFVVKGQTSSDEVITVSTILSCM
jgi:ABC-type phosphate transport system ATPase subunit